MRPTIRDGWLMAPYTGGDAAVVEVGVARAGSKPDEWQPAFLDTLDGQRVAMIRPPGEVASRSDVWVRSGPSVVNAGRIA